MLDGTTVYRTLPATDLEPARGFWEKTVGLTPAEVTEAGVWYHLASDSRHLLFPSGGHASGTHTQIGFRVPDLEQTVASLRTKGVEFENYDMPGLKTVNRIADMAPGNRAAWFRDSEGNMIGVIQMSEDPA